MKNLFITGVSSGLGHALATTYLDRNWQVFGASRRTPDDISEHPNFRFRCLDLREQQDIGAVLTALLGGIERLDLAILNAGIIGQIDDLSRTPLMDLKSVMDINVWANKIIIDHLYADNRTVAQIVTISSGASVNGNRGWGGYSLSKAALNMLTKLYAREYPHTHFCALAPGIIHTPMAEDICRRLSDDERFPTVKEFCAKRNTRYMLTPQQAAQAMIDAIGRLPALVGSGEYADVRNL
uniref:NAD(P)-dependent dehydrogenase, short-chain alcohol dehydrogenase family n=1 Tax=Candidatus Kentrum sp. FW TaxID=2126338 RepID=A0A450SFY4_9GAMM|nr:MAG: NAD(P)-dependent dehydrogenase, short-chain alcohol dehydrogenase family [Candidatus Kentron sp. FW]